MKTSLYTSIERKTEVLAFLKPQRGKTSGMVLIIVLCCVALLAILVVGFLSSSSTEVAASKQFSSSAEVQNLASSALNLVMGQVAAATKAEGVDPNNRISWASQPGVIRTYTTTGTALGTCYKLYSSSQMEALGDDFNTPAGIAADLPPTSWNILSGMYTDLNAPVLLGTTLRFPIVDPRADTRISGDALGVAGFTYRESGVTGAILPPPADADEARLPMPVKWLYVLKNGEFVSPGSTGTASKVTISGATKTNPIVGRVAFWTDDESCKVNINTASEGIFWDVPMAHLSQEGPFNKFTTAAGEYQRYMGHPAQTSLSVIFPWLKGATLGSKDDAYLTLTPRVVAGGSKEGTIWFSDPNPVPSDSDRLYDSVDELAFDQSRKLRGMGVPVMHLSPDDIERRRFFLTAQSRSPEVTLFSTPRVAIWPLHSNPGARHAAEKLIALAATAGTGGRQYYFTRATPFDPLADFKDLIDIGTGRPVGRNGEILGYLRKETEMPIPGYDTKTFAKKWEDPDTLFNDRDQILVEIYDYIRSCINLRTTVQDGVIKATGTSYTRNVNGSGEVYPTVLPSMQPLSTGIWLGDKHDKLLGFRGFGRFPTIREVAVLFACETDPHMEETHESWTLVQVVDPATQLNTAMPGWDPADDKNDPSDPANAANIELAAKPTKMWPAIIIEMFLPAQGLKQWIPNVKVSVSGLQSFKWKIARSTLTNKFGKSIPPATSVASPWQPTEIDMFASDTKVFNAVSSFAGGLAPVANGYTATVMLYTDKGGVGQPPERFGYGRTDDPEGPTVENWSTDFQFMGGTLKITVDLALPDSASQGIATNDPNAPPIPATEDIRQYFQIEFPPIPRRLPNPRQAWQHTFDNLGAFNGLDKTSYSTMSNRLKYYRRHPTASQAVMAYADTSSSQYTLAGKVTGPADNWWYPQFPDMIKSMVVKHGDYRLVAAAASSKAAPIKGGVGCSELNLLGSSDNVFVPHADYFNGLPDETVDGQKITVTNSWLLYARPSARALIPSYLPANSANHYVAHNLRYNPKMAVYPQTSGVGSDPRTNGQRIGRYVLGPKLPYPYLGWGGVPDGGPSISPGIAAANSKERQGDWDNGIGDSADGPFINKVDEGTDFQLNATGANGYLNYLAENMDDAQATINERTFGPMRQIASPVMFGSLSTGVKRNRPWETLLFCPNPAASFSGDSGAGGFTSDQHPGFEEPPDHLLLDLFWMPVTEPYAISDSFSTAGKINLNCQILPFTYITRTTGMRAILANQKVTAFEEVKPPIAGFDALAYKQGWNTGPTQIHLDQMTPSPSRWDIDANETLKQFDTKFLGGEIFKSATQICEMFLVPQEFDLADTKSLGGFWTTRRITGDNMRERPYNAIYPRVTTRSNVYTVYVKAQALKQTKSTLDGSPETFTEGKDQVESTFQASYTFERYLDPNASASLNDTDILGPYKMRVINQRNLSW